MYSYSLRDLRQLDNSIRNQSNNTSCTLFRKDLDFWFCYAVPRLSVSGLDICRNLLLLEKFRTKKLELFCITPIWLFEKGFDKMKLVNYILCQNTYTVINIETYVYINTQKRFLFMFKIADCSAMKKAVSASQSLVLFEQRSSYPPPHWAEWDFCPFSYLQVVKRFLGKKKYQILV